MSATERTGSNPGDAGPEQVAGPHFNAWERLGRVLFRARGHTPVVLILVVLLWPTPGGLEWWRLAASTALMVLGAALRFWSVGVAGKQTRTRTAYTRELITTGPFALVRNPIYLGNFLITYGLALLSKIGWLMWVFPILFFFQYAAIVAWEERVLSRAFGRTYEDYRRTVGRWIPSRSPHREPSTRRARVFETAARSERGTLTTVAVIYCLILAKHLIYRQVIEGLFRGAR